jgi:hypothetical protein
MRGVRFAPSERAHTTKLRSCIPGAKFYIPGAKKKRAKNLVFLVAIGPRMLGLGKSLPVQYLFGQRSAVSYNKRARATKNTRFLALFFLAPQHHRNIKFST